MSRSQRAKQKAAAIAKNKKQERPITQVGAGDVAIGTLVAIGSLLASNFFSDGQRGLGLILTYITIGVACYGVLRHISISRRWVYYIGVMLLTLVGCAGWWKSAPSKPGLTGDANAKTEQAPSHTSPTITPATSQTLVVPQSAPSTGNIPPGFKPQPNTRPSPADRQFPDVTDLTKIQWVRLMTVDSFGSPLSEVNIDITPGINGKPFHCTTGMLGADCSLNLPVGTYSITLTHTQGAYHSVTEPLYVLKQSEPGPQAIQFALHRKQDAADGPSAIQGIVVDYTTNNGIADVTITIEDEQTKRKYKRTTGESGSFRFPFPHGWYSITFTHNNYQEASTRCQVPQTCILSAADQIALRKKIN